MVYTSSFEEAAIVNKETDVYRELQKYLNKMPVGYPATQSGVELRLLKFLFTPEQAQIALALDYKFQTAEQIHERVRDWGISIEELKTILEGMVDKGNTFSKEQGGVRVYANMPFITGMAEFQINRLTPELVGDINEYVQEQFAAEYLGTKVPQTRIIPIQKSITAEHRVGTYDEFRYIIQNAEGRIRIGECICRKAMQMSGHTCKVTTRRESCMAFREFADMLGRMNWGRTISKEEALEIASEAEEDGLVLQSANEEDVQFICSCCGDCCAILRIAKAMPRPADFLVSNYYAAGDPESCEGCGTCVERCQMEAVALRDEVAVVDRDRCIGCGNCVPTCPSETIHLVKKEQEVVPPKNSEALYDAIMAHKRIGL
jgi:electron transport complex protein RnfB